MRHTEFRFSCRQVRDAAPLEPSDERQARRIQAFAAGHRPAILQLIRLSPAVEDLADSFPALLFALATGYGTNAARRSALAAVLDGQSLREVAGLLGLPVWLRKLPAAVFQTPLARPPAETSLVNRLVSLIPPQPAIAAAWLDRVMIAHHTGRPELALWVAQNYRAAQPVGTSASFLGVLAWAWFAGARGQRAEALLTTRWTPTLGTQRAAKEATQWKQRLALDVMLGPGLADTWLADGTAGGYQFVALRNADDFIAEALAMDNCLDRYADRLDGRAARIFSIQCDGRSVADLEIAPHEREPGHPAIAQLRGPRNRRAPIEVWQAAYAWLGAQPLRLAEPRLEVKPGRAVRNKRRALLWRPFLDALPEHARTAIEESILPGAATDRMPLPAGARLPAIARRRSSPPQPGTS